MRATPRRLDALPVTGDSLIDRDIAVEKPLSHDDLETLIVHILRNRNVRDEARNALDPELLSEPGEAGLRAVVRAVFDETKSGESLPYTLACAIVREALDNDPTIDKDHWNDILAVPKLTRHSGGLLHYAFKIVDKEDLSPPLALSLLQRFLRDRQIGNLVRDLASRSHQGVVDYGAYFQTIEGSNRKIEAIGLKRDFSLMIPENFETQPVRERFPFGMPAMDEPTKGGARAGEVTGFIGMVHAGKSTTSAQIAVANGYRFGDAADNNPLNGRHVFIFSYEDPAELVRARIWSNAGSVPRDAIESQKLSRTGNLKDYELARARQQQIDPATFPGEYERIQRAMARLNPFLHIIDMRGGDDGSGMGGEDEVATKLSRYADDGLIPGLVIIDFVKVMIDRYIAKRGTRGDIDSARIRAIETCPDNVKRLITNRYDCHGFLLQQFAGSETAKSWNAKLHASGASGCKSFFERVDNCFLLGNRERESQCAYIQCDKTRESTGAGERHLVHYDIHSSRFVSADGRYAVANGKVVAANLATTIVKAAPPPPKKGPGRMYDMYVDNELPWK